MTERQKTKKTKSSKKYPKSRYWCATINFTQEMVEDDELADSIEPLCDLLEWMPLSTYVVYQTERVSHLHIQMYIEFSRQVRRSHILKNWCWLSIPHLETRRGTQEHAIGYCRKLETAVEGTQHEYGIPFTPKKRQQNVETVGQDPEELYALCPLCDEPMYAHGSPRWFEVRMMHMRKHLTSSE